MRSHYISPWRVDVETRDGVPRLLSGTALARVVAAALEAAGAPEPASIGLVLGDDAELAQRMSDRAVRLLRATDAGELLPRVAATRDFLDCRFCPWAERCWSLRA